ncbi:unnamed protein product [Acanthoscelides obtectus]|uniref:Uncharacterized protein n=1 Tax=Acanthoscelides obtectus TaxID=200917 RepID=A0A9P0JQK1_ACAOB|nr:unnamed protein product [Acanthoscelides obtectus]CAK1661760.1 hypothetical protein AOBTE_LOCUS22781 [Acanthoscelides obtectus]
MVIGLAKTVLCFHFFLCIVHCYQTDDHRTKKHQVTSHLADSRHKPSRYSKFDKVMTRIENLRVEDESPNKQNYRLRHKGSYHSYRKTTTTTTTTESSLFDLGEDNFEDYYSDGLIGRR